MNGLNISIPHHGRDPSVFPQVFLPPLSFIFILFVAFLRRTQISNFYLDLAFALTGRSRGRRGQGVGCGLQFFWDHLRECCGKHRGHGEFYHSTLIIKSGYTTPLLQGLLRPLSSTGGQLMPPIMGAAAFVMAELTGIPYWDICKSRCLPGPSLLWGSLLHDPPGGHEAGPKGFGKRGTAWPEGDVEKRKL